MAHLEHRSKGKGKKQWSVCEKRRINGKPRTIILQYLGTASTILEKFQVADQVKLKSYSHGDTHVLLRLAKELDIAGIINKHVPRLKKKNKVSIGTTILLAAIGRICRPTSKRGWYDWCKGTSLEYFSKGYIDLSKLDSDHFYQHMKAVPIEAIPKIEEEIIKKVVARYDIKPEVLLYDYTNFYTYINTTNDRSTLTQRGKNKQKRYDLRQFSMAMLTDRSQHFPLYHNVYQGNQNDSKTFRKLFTNVRERLHNLFENTEKVTMVFDKGNNSKINFEKIDQEKNYYYIGSLSTRHFAEYVQRANNNFKEIEIDGEVIPVFKKQLQVWGKRRTCVIFISEELREGQVRGVFQTLDKCIAKLNEYKTNLQNTKKKVTKKQVTSKVNKLIKGKHMKEIIKYTVKKVKGEIHLNFEINHDYIEHLVCDKFGRIILVTNRHKWSPEEIIKAYRGQYHVENIFKNLKNTFHMAVRPSYHYIDHNLQVHVFSCIIGYILAAAAFTEAKQNAKYKQSLSGLLEDLKNIRISGVKKIHASKRSWKYQLEELNKKEKNLCEAMKINDKNIKIKIPQ